MSCEWHIDPEEKIIQLKRRVKRLTAENERLKKPYNAIVDVMLDGNVHVMDEALVEARARIESLTAENERLKKI